MRHFLHLAYKGTKYHGWQRQAKHISVQEVLEIELAKITGRQRHIAACGRTDAGVHASSFYAHTDLEETLDKETIAILNKNLPEAIQVFDCLPMHERAHAQRDATARTYNYFIHYYKNPFIVEQSSHYDLQDPNLKAMAEAVSMLSQYEDFEAFCLRPLDYKHTRCYIKDAQLFHCEANAQIRFEITGSRFLHGMIRLLVDKLIKTARNRMSIQDWKDCFNEELESPLKKRAYPQGLFLTNVTYPYPNFPPRNIPFSELNWKKL